jgi:hypothetical protein
LERPRFSYGAGDKFVVTFGEAARLLKGKGRRGFEILEIIDDAPRPPKRP